MKRFLFLLLPILFYSCSDQPATPPNTTDSNTPCDTCFNDAQITSYDSTWQQWPSPRYMISNMKQSQYSGFWIGEVLSLYFRDSGWNQGMFIYDPATRKLVQYYDFWLPELSHDGKQVLVQYGFKGFGVIDLATMDITQLTTEEFSFPNWSLDDSWIFASKYNQIYRFKPDGTEVKMIASGIRGARQFEQYKFAGFANDEIRIYDMESDSLIRIQNPFVPSVALSSNDQWDLSPDRTRLLVSTMSNKGLFDREHGGLFMYNLLTHEAKRILPPQYWGNQYYPKWSSNSTFFGTYYCRKDSVAMVYEYDLNGKVLRQVTYKEMKMYP